MWIRRRRGRDGEGKERDDEKERRRERAQEETRGESRKNYSMTAVNKHTGVSSSHLHTKQEANVKILPESWLNFAEE